MPCHHIRSGLLTALVAMVALAAPATGLAAPVLEVDVAAQRHAISDGIYGFNEPDPALAVEVGVPVDRWGGNLASRYDYRSGLTNSGGDWYFQNRFGINNQSVGQFVGAARQRGSASYVTVPMLDWVSTVVPASDWHATPLPCSYPRTQFPTQQSFDPWEAGMAAACGNGRSPAGANLPGADPARTSSPTPPTYAADFVAHLVNQYGTAASGGVATYVLDNEPGLWHDTHRDVHPAKLTYDELWAKSRATALGIKQADPTALVAGPADWGWCALASSAADGCTPGADHAAHGGVDLVPWYLRQFRLDADANGGRRLLDYLDEHYYPQSPNGAPSIGLSPAGDAATQARRLRSTRSLWDPTYVDESWIGADLQAPPIQLIPKLRGWVAQEYPGTKLAIGEYNFGAMESVNGALAQADVLGIFGRERVDIATIWGGPSANQPAANAFRIYRNYDGVGGRFGDVSVAAASSDQGQLAVYAAERSSDGALTVLVLNKSTAAVTSDLRLRGAGVRAGQAATYRYDASMARVSQGAALPVSAGGWSATYPASSMTLVVLARGQGPVTQPPTPPAAPARSALAVTLRAASPVVRAPSRVVLTATVRPRVRARVLVQRRVGARWVTVARVRASASGVARVRLAKQPVGVRRYRAVIAATATHRAATSRTATVRIRAERARR